MRIPAENGILFTRALSEFTYHFMMVFRPRLAFLSLLLACRVCFGPTPTEAEKAASLRAQMTARRPRTAQEFFEKYRPENYREMRSAIAETQALKDQDSALGDEYNTLFEWSDEGFRELDPDKAAEIWEKITALKAPIEASERRQYNLAKVFFEGMGADVPAVFDKTAPLNATQVKQLLELPWDFSMAMHNDWDIGFSAWGVDQHGFATKVVDGNSNMYHSWEDLSKALARHYLAKAETIGDWLEIANYSPYARSEYERERRNLVERGLVRAARIGDARFSWLDQIKDRYQPDLEKTDVGLLRDTLSPLSAEERNGKSIALQLIGRMSNTYLVQRHKDLDAPGARMRKMIFGMALGPDDPPVDEIDFAIPDKYAKHLAMQDKQFLFDVLIARLEAEPTALPPAAVDRINFIAKELSLRIQVATDELNGSAVVTHVPLTPLQRAGEFLRCKIGDWRSYLLGS